MDDIDRKIIAALEENARVTAADLARKLQIMPKTLADRLRRLETEGVIEGYHAAISPVKAGFALRAFIGLQSQGEAAAKVISLARTIPEVKELHRCEGRYSFLMRVVARDEEDLKRVLDAFAEHGSKECLTVVSTPLTRRIT